MLIIVCVLRTGGDYKEEHVLHLLDEVSAACKHSFDFRVITDSPLEIPHITKHPLSFRLKGWWSKLELFHHMPCDKPILYFDLDTIIWKDITPLIEKVQQIPLGGFRMLTPFNGRYRSLKGWASGVMAWHGDFSFLLADYLKNEYPFHGDQEYITSRLKEKAVEIKPINKWANIVSYKRHCQKGVPQKADIICFHGKPRPHDIPLLWNRRN